MYGGAIVRDRAPGMSHRAWSAPTGMGVLALGYFVAYIPFAALTRALSSGLLPGSTRGRRPRAAAGGGARRPGRDAALFLCVTGWWRYIGLREVGGRMRRLPSRTMIAAGVSWR